MLKPIQAIVGKDIFLQIEKLRQIIAQSPPDSQRVNFDGETAEFADVGDELRTFSMFSSAKVVVVRNAELFIKRWREPLEEYLAKPSEKTILILRANSITKTERVYKLIQKTGQVHDCEPPKPLEPWIIARAREAHQLKLSTDAARALADLVGPDMGKLDNELARLALLTDGKAEAPDVLAAVTFQLDQQMFDMTNELAMGNTAMALRRWRYMVQTDSSTEFRAPTWLAMWLEDARTLLTAAREFKNGWRYPGDKLARFRTLIQSLGLAGIDRLLEMLVEIEFRAKTGRGQLNDGVERFIISAGPPGRPSPGR